jgi:hypothetical protein
MSAKHDRYSYCILAGNVVDGMTVYGPFLLGDEANEWAEANLDGEDWWVTKLWGPE